MAEGSGEPAQVQPPPSPRRYWTRRGLAEWLREELDRDIPTLVGIDHAFSFPLAYFEKYRLSSDWQGFLEDFHHYWPTDAPHTYVCFIREDPHGRGKWRTGERSWLRVTETWTATAKSVFGFGVQGEVATSTHAGLPWLLYLREAVQAPSSLLAVRRLGGSRGQVGRRRGLPVVVDTPVPEGRPRRRRTSGLCGGGVAATCGPQRLSGRVPQSEPDRRGARYRQNRGVDSRSRLNRRIPSVLRHPHNPELA